MFEAIIHKGIQVIEGIVILLFNIHNRDCKANLGIGKLVYKENNMKKTIALLTLIVILLSGCSESASSPATSTQTLPAPTNTESPTSTPTTTPDPLSGAPEGTTGINSAGQWIKAVAENGHNYEYIYNTEAGEWIREIARFPLWDSVVYDYVIYTISAYENTPGERSVYTVVHRDVVSNGDWTPFNSTFKPELEQRYFGLGNLESVTNEQSAIFQREMMKGLQSNATIPIIVANGTQEGETLNIKLSTETGINVTIMDPTTIQSLGGENVIKLNNGTVTFYVQAYGVDENGNALYRLAFEGSMNDISDKALREILFMIVGNCVEYIDQRQQGFTPTAQIFSMYSAKPRANGEPDFSFERVPLTQP